MGLEEDATKGGSVDEKATFGGWVQESVGGWRPPSGFASRGEEEGSAHAIEFPFTSDPCFLESMKNKRLCKAVVEAVIGKSVDEVVSVSVGERTGGALGSRGAVLDVVVRLGDRIVDLEMQRSRKGAIGERMRYYQASLDAHLTMPGGEEPRVEETHIVFLGTVDLAGNGLPRNTFHMVSAEDPSLVLPTKSHWHVLYSGAWENEADRSMRELLRYMAQGEPCGSLSGAIHDEVTRLNGDRAFKEGARAMMTVEMDMKLQKMWAREEGLEEGRAESTARLNSLIEKLLADGRVDDLQRSASDPAFQNELLAEYGLQ